MKTAKFLIAVALCSGPAFAQSPAIDIHVDAREAARHIYKAQLKVAVPPGPVTLLYPKWIPGEHGPTGPLANLVDLQIMAGSQRLTWQRDPLDMYRIQVVVPAGTDHLDIALSFVGGFSSEKLGVVSWNEVVLFPAGKPAPEISVKASLTLPNGWSGVGALDRTPAQGEIVLPQVDLATLIDSPILMGEYLSNLDLHPRSEGGVPGLPHALHVAGERAAAVTIPASFQETYTRLAEEAGALFGSRHYAHYDWLLSLTDMPRGFGGLSIISQATISCPKIPCWSRLCVRAWRGFWLTNLSIPGTVNTAVRWAWSALIIKSLWTAVFSGFTRGSPAFLARCSRFAPEP